MEQLPFAIIGCGQIAQRHAKHIADHGKLLAVCDIDAGKAQALADQTGAVPYSSIEALLNSEHKPAIAVICTPNGLHAEHAIRCLHAGCDVLVEKPMALTAEDCDIMIQAAKLAGQQLFTVVQNRFNKPVLAVKEALDAGAFGEISSIQLSCFWNRPASYYAHPWHGKKEMDGGILFTQFSHFIDLLYWFFGEVVTVSALTRNAEQREGMEIEDCGAALIGFKNGAICTAHFSVNSFGKNHEGALTILGSKGTARIGGEYLNTIEYALFDDYTIPLTTDDTPANRYGAYHGSMSNHGQVYSDLARHLHNGTPYYVSNYEAMKTVELIEKIYAAANR